MSLVRRTCLLVCAGALSAVCALGHARSEEASLRVNVFPEAQNLALFAAKENGFFARHGLSVEVTFTPTSTAQREGLVRGDFEIAQAGVDNAVALVQVAKQDVIIVAGGGDGGNRLIVRPEVGSIGDLRGKTIVVDSPVTAYAFLAYKMLQVEGLSKGEYEVRLAGGCPQRLEAMRSDPSNAAAMLNPPCSLRALREGFHDFGLATGAVGPYQADGIWVKREWAAAHGDALVRYLRSIIEGYRWAADPANRQRAASILAQYLDVDPELAIGAVDATVGSGGSLAKDAALDMEGLRNTLRLRAEFAGGERTIDPQRYVDLSYHRRALEAVRD